MFYDNCEAIMKLFSLSRHTFLNHLQVISGLAQLNKSEKLFYFVRKVSKEVQQLGHLASCGDPRLALLVYEFFSKVPESRLSLEFNGTLPMLAPVSLLSTAELLAACNEYLLKEKNVSLVMLFTGGDSPSIFLRFSSGSEARPDIGALQKDVARSGLHLAVTNDGGILLQLNQQQAARE